MMWKELLTFVSGATIISGVIAWLVATLTKYQMDRNVKSFESGLQQEMEKFKLELQKQSLAHQIVYKRVDENVAEALPNVYASLRALSAVASDYLSPFDAGGDPPKLEKVKRVHAANQQFIDCLVSNRLYIPPALYSRLDGFAVRLITACNEFTVGLIKENSRTGVDSPGHWQAASDAVKDELIPLYDDIVREFQKRLGIA